MKVDSVTAEGPKGTRLVVLEGTFCAKGALFLTLKKGIIGEFLAPRTFLEYLGVIFDEDILIGQK